MAAVIESLSLTNPVFRAFIFWSTVMLLKMMAMSLLTGMQRFKNKVCRQNRTMIAIIHVINFQTFANPEDTKSFKNLKPKFGVEDVERVRRAHRNDLENILAFISVAFFYVLTSPQAFLAINLFRASAIARIVHTLVYAIVPAQPWRALSWAVCYFSTIYMGVQVLFFFM
jgi:glutathione S-transferase